MLWTGRNGPRNNSDRFRFGMGFYDSFYDDFDDYTKSSILVCERLSKRKINPVRCPIDLAD